MDTLLQDQAVQPTLDPTPKSDSAQPNSPGQQPLKKVPRKPWSRPTIYKVAAAALTLLLVLAYLARNMILGTPVAGYLTSVSALQQTVVASGRVASAQRISIASVLGGRIRAIPVLEGQEVQRGQILIVLDEQDALAELARARSNVRQSDAGVRKQQALALPSAEQALLSAQSQENQAQLQYQRIRELRSRRFVSPLQLDEAQRNVDVARAQTRTAALSVQSNQAQGADALAATASLAQAQASAQSAEVKLAQHTVVAPARGTLIGRNVEAGDTVQAGAELMQLAPLGPIEIVVLIDEKNLAKLALGQKALVSADAYPLQRFAAEVSFINPGIDAARGAVEVKLQIKTAPAYLREDMTISADIETGFRARALVVDTAGIHDLATSAPWALVVRDSRVMRQALRLGLRGDAQLEVLDGLVAGELVLPASLATIRAGQRVRATAIAPPQAPR